MRVSSSVMASIQQAQNRDTRNEFGRGIQETNKGISGQDKSSQVSAYEKAHEDKVARIKESIKNGTYKLDLAATSERMAQSLLNI